MRKEKWEPKGNSSEAPIVVAARKVGLTENVSLGWADPGNRSKGEG